MITEQMIKRSLEDSNEPDLIIKEGSSCFIAYFRKSSDKVGIGKTEIEALNNLEYILKKVSKELDEKVKADIDELKRKHRKLWNY